MKWIGHVATAVIAATPLIALHERVVTPVAEGDALPPYVLLAWTAAWAVVPDFDIMLSCWTPIRHRGFLSHSLFTALVAGALVLGVGILLPHLELPSTWPAWVHAWAGDAGPYLTPFMALLASLAVFVHLLGDAMTVSGVPLLYPGQEWHIPFVGGYAVFDNYFLNAVPVVVAGYLVMRVFGYAPEILRGLGRW